MTLIEWTAILGNIGEFVGSLAVLVTLIYLTVQVRHSKKLLEENRKIALGQAYQTRTGFRLEGSRAHMDPTWTETQAKLRGGSKEVPMEVLLANFEKLSPSEQLQVKYFSEGIVHAIDNNLFQRELDLIDNTTDDFTPSIIKQYPIWEKSGAFLPRRVQAVVDGYKRSSNTDTQHDD